MYRGIYDVDDKLGWQLNAFFPPHNLKNVQQKTRKEAKLFKNTFCIDRIDLI